jgi:quercetin dioxygenase-like cupin family protein
MNQSNFENSKPYLLRDSVEYSGGSIVSKIVTRNEAGNITLFAFDQGQNLSEHTAPYDAIVQIIEGEALISINREGHQLKEGEIIIMPANIPHAVDGPGKFKMLLTMIKAH